jgi:hypothetical protein
MGSIPEASYYVWATDSFMSDWGPVKNMDNVIVFTCDTRVEADIVARNLRDRDEMKGVRVSREQPPVRPRTLYSIKDKTISPTFYTTTRPFRDNPGPTVENAGEDPEIEAVKFYPVTTNYSEFRDHPDAARARVLRISEEEARRIRYSEDPFSSASVFYRGVLEIIAVKLTGSIERAACVSEWGWHENLEPEYKAWPAAIVALAATKMEIGCEHLRLPFPAFAIRLPEGYVSENDGKAPPIRSVFVTIFKNTSDGMSYQTTSLDGPRHTKTPLIGETRWRSMGQDVPALLSIMIKWKENPRNAVDDSFAVFSIGLVPGETLEHRLNKLEYTKNVRAGRDVGSGRANGFTGINTNYMPSEKLVRELFSLAVGTSFFATSRVRKRPDQTSIITKDKRPRPERRRFEKAHGEEQPTFNVGRELMLPREAGVPSAAEAGEKGPGEGTGRELKFGHFRTGHIRKQPYGGRGEEKTIELIFVEPTIVRQDLPLRGRSTPGEIRDAEGTYDVTEEDS